MINFLDLNSYYIFLIDLTSYVLSKLVKFYINNKILFNKNIHYLIKNQYFIWW